MIVTLLEGGRVIFEACGTGGVEFVADLVDDPATQLSASPCSPDGAAVGLTRG